MVVYSSSLQSLSEVKLEDSVLAGVVPQQGLLVLPLEGALCVGAGVWPAVGEDLVYPLFEVLHDQVVLLLPVLVLGLWFEPTELAGVSCAKPICIFGQSLYVKHGDVRTGVYTCIQVSRVDLGCVQVCIPVYR